jgi:hypothetical protein
MTNLNLHVLYWLVIISIIVYYRDKKCIISGKLPDVNKAVSNLNSGGCGIFAYRLYARLDSTRYQIVTIGDGYHIMVFDNKTNMYIDSKGVHDNFYINLHYPKKDVKIISEDSLYEMLQDTSLWNSEYDRTQDLIIQKYLDQL